jgi:hypothetical protein
MSGLEPIMLMAAVGGSALSAAGSLMAGQEKSNAAEIQSQQQKTAAAQAEAQRRDELTSSLETISAIRAGRGVGSQSPTGLAIFDEITANAERDIGIEKSNYLTRADMSRQAAEMSGRKAKTALLAGYLGAGEAVLSGATKAYSIGSGRYPVSGRVGA